MPEESLISKYRWTNIYDGPATYITARIPGLTPTQYVEKFFPSRHIQFFDLYYN